MAFTEAQRIKIRKYLGIPHVNQYLDPRLEGRMDLVGANAAAQAEAETILAAIIAAETKMVSSLDDAGLKRADEVEWYPGKNGAGTAGLDAAKNEARLYCSQLSNFFGVPIVNDAFGTGGYGGDWFMGPGFQRSGGMIRMG